ncbi:hypothetical protein HAX54_005009, partial [Datura stramonium]|nr:hypothetical protein [Datura stramonium]
LLMNPSEQHCTPVVIGDDFPPRHSLPYIKITTSIGPNRSEDTSLNFHVSPGVIRTAYCISLGSRSTPPPQ